MKLSDIERRKLIDAETILRRYCAENNVEWVTVTVGTEPGEVSVGLPASCDEFHLIETSQTLADFLEQIPPTECDEEDDDSDEFDEEAVREIGDFGKRCAGTLLRKIDQATDPDPVWHPRLGDSNRTMDVEDFDEMTKEVIAEDLRDLLDESFPEKTEH